MSMQNNLKRYFIAFCSDLMAGERLDYNLSSLLDVFENPKTECEQYLCCESGRQFLLKAKNFGPFIYVSLTSLSPYLFHGSHWKTFPFNQYHTLNSGNLAFIKVIPASNFIFYEREDRAITMNRRIGKPFDSRTCLKRVSIKNDHPRLTFYSRSRIRKSFGSRYFSFKNISLLKKYISKSILLICFPKANTPWVQELINSYLNWNVSFNELQTIDSKKEFLSKHFENNQSCFKVTHKLTKWPLPLIHNLAFIKSVYNASVIEQMFANLSLSKLCISTDYNPYYIYLYFKIIAYTDNISESTIYLRDYISMCTQLNREPNLKIKSFKRLVSEHDKLAKIIALNDVRVFEAPVPNVKEAEYEGVKIAYIKNEKDLIEESVRMKHCVASYEWRIISGKSIIYRVESETERATLELEKGISDTFYLRQIKGPFNKSVTEKLIDTVKDILAKQPIKIEYVPETKGEETVTINNSAAHPYDIDMPF